MSVFQTLWRLHKKGDLDELKGLLHYFYTLLMLDALNDHDVVERLAELGEYPTIVVTAHGALAQLPFSALFDGKCYLAERFNIVQATPLFADGEFQEGELDFEAVWGGERMASREVRVVAGGEHLPQIEFEIADLKALSAEVGFPLQLWPEHDLAWSADTIRWLFGTEGIALLSAHMLASPRHASETMFVSPNGGMMGVGVSIPKNAGTGILLLSGCRSAGFTDWLAPNESSVVSLCRKSGVQSVVSTLWPARDYPARLYNVELITGLSRGLPRATAHGAALRHVMTASASLGQMHFAERLVRQSDRKNIEIRSDETILSHPNFWGCFVLTGAWR